MEEDIFGLVLLSWPLDLLFGDFQLALESRLLITLLTTRSLLVSEHSLLPSRLVCTLCVRHSVLLRLLLLFQIHVGETYVLRSVFRIPASLHTEVMYSVQCNLDYPIQVRITRVCHPI